MTVKTLVKFQDVLTSYCAASIDHGHFMCHFVYNVQQVIFPRLTLYEQLD